MSNIQNTYGTIKRNLLRWKNNLHNKRQIAINVAARVFREKLVEYNRQMQLGCNPIVCYVPMLSLYFGFNGNVTVCCFTEKFNVERRTIEK